MRRGRASPTTSSARCAASRGRRGQARDRPVRAGQPQGQANLEEALDGIGLRHRVGWLPFAHAWRTAWSKAGAPAGGALPRAVRRPPFLGLDVSASALRRPCDDDPRPRPAPPSRVDDAAHARDALREVPERRGDLRRRLCQLDLHREMTSPSCCTCQRSGSSWRRPGSAPTSDRRASAPNSAAVRPDSGDAGAEEEPGDAARRVPAARHDSCWPSPAARVGPEVELERAGVRGLGYVTDEELAGSTAAPRPLSSPPVRGLRNPGRRGDGERHAGGRLLARVAGRRERGAAVRVDPDRPRRSRRESRRRSAGAMSSSRRARPCAPLHLGGHRPGFPGRLLETLGR